MPSGTIRVLVWRVMEVVDGMILRVRVCEGGSICDLFWCMKYGFICCTIV